jgi:hypothetical protein
MIFQEEREKWEGVRKDIAFFAAQSDQPPAAASTKMRKPLLEHGLLEAGSGEMLEG